MSTIPVNPQVVVAIFGLLFTILVALAGVLIQAGRLLQRQSAVESRIVALASYEASKAEMEQRLRSLEARVKDLEHEDKARMAELSELRVDLSRLIQAVEDLKRQLETSLRRP